jgi:hypothetical protein
MTIAWKKIIIHISIIEHQSMDEEGDNNSDGTAPLASEANNGLAAQVDTALVDTGPAASLSYSYSNTENSGVEVVGPAIPETSLVDIGPATRTLSESGEEFRSAMNAKRNVDDMIDGDDDSVEEDNHTHKYY